MPWAKIYQLYQELQTYVGWTDDDARRVAAAAHLLDTHVDALIDDFYDEIGRHPEARRVITGGAEQVARLKETLKGWLRDLLSGQYNQSYVSRRWRVGLRHVEIGLSQVYTNAALSRLRRGLLRAIDQSWTGELAELLNTRASLNTLLDLDLAIIEDAYQTEFSRRQQQTERLATIGQVAGGVAHELRNPLNVVKTSVYFLLNMRQASPEKVKQHLERIDRQIGLADRVIAALSDFARLPVPEANPAPVRECLQEVLELNAVPASIAVSIECSDDVPPILGDARQLQIVFGNLVRNARDAMPDGGRLTLSAIADDGDVLVSVADTGVGIPRETLERVTEPLYSTKARGIGLGLAITRSIVEKHGGQVQIESEPGVGSVFTIRLPAAPASLKPPGGE